MQINKHIAKKWTMPHLIVHVETTVATQQDIEVVEPIRHDLQQQALLPDEHLVDSGYVSGEKLADSFAQYGVKFVYRQV